MHQVSLPQSGSSVEIQRIIGLSGGFRYCQAGGMGKFIAASHHKGIEFIFRVQIGVFRIAVSIIVRTVL